MSQRAEELSERFAAFNNDVVSFVDKCSADDWRQQCSGEGWTVGVVTHHIAAGHYSTLAWAKMIVEGQPLPDVGFDVIHQANAQHAQEHADCTQEAVLGLLREDGAAIAEYVAGLNDTDLDRTAYLSLTGGDISAGQFIENIIIHSGGEHFASAKATASA